MHAYLLELASLMAVFSFAIVAPGADTAMVMRQAMVHGRRAAILTSVGIGTSLMFHVSYTILGLGIIISQSLLLFGVIKWVGAAYLIYMGVMALRAGTTDLTPVAGEADAPRQSAFRAFGLGFLANALNPKPVLFFLSIFSALVSASNPRYGEVRLWPGHGNLPHRVVRRRLLLHDDAAHACGLLPHEQVDQPGLGSGVHRLWPETRGGKGQLR